MLAIKRTARVPGRIKFLIVSINTIKGIKGPGVLCGTKCANMCLAWLIHPNIINDSQRGSLMVSVSTKCLEEVKMYGNNPIKLLRSTNKNSLINIVVLPLKASGPSRFLNS